MDPTTISRDLALRRYRRPNGTPRDKTPRACIQCDRMMRIIRTTDRGPYCVRCYNRYLVPRHCKTCNRTVRWEPDAPQPLCRVCRRKAYLATLACAVCRGPVEKLDAWTEHGPICHRCYPKVKPIRRCGYCRKPTRYVSRCLQHGVTRFACQRCLLRRLPACAECGRRCRHYGPPEEPVRCRACRRGTPPRLHPCRCGAVVKYVCKGLCVNCYWRDVIIPPTVDRLATTGLRRPWTRMLFREYAQDLMERHPAMRSVPRILRRELVFYSLLERAFAQTSQLSNVRLAERLGPKPLWQFKRAIGSLIRHQHLAPMDTPEVEWALLRWKLERYRAPLRETWMDAPYVAFERELHRRRRLYAARGHTRTTTVLAPSGFKSALRSASRFLLIANEAGIRSTSQMNQHLLDRTLAETRLQSAHLGRFVEFLNTKTPRFSKLKLSVCPVRWDPRRVICGDQFDRLVARLLTPTGRSTLRGSLITLICLLYAQPPHIAVAFPLIRLRQTSKGWEIRPAALWLEMPAEVGRLLTLWMSSRREQAIMEATQTSPFLFPGRRVGQSYTVSSLYWWLRPYGISPKQLTPAAIANLCRNGLTTASVAYQAYGIKRATLQRYLEHFAPTHGWQASRLLKQGSRASRRRT